jgi:hypothetical protein
MATQPIDLSSGLVPSTPAPTQTVSDQAPIDLSAGLVPANQTVQQNQTQAPTATISAVKPTAHIGEALSRWTENVMNDIKYGTDLTGVGTVLKKMGAHGVYAGNPQAVGDFMASLPLGAIKALGGAGKVASGRPWYGTKDIVSGALQAATMPSMFITPEAGEIAAEGANVTKNAVASGIGKVTAPIREAAAQPELQAGIRRTAQRVAEAAEVPAPKNPSLFKTVEEAGDNVLAKSKEQYAELDKATGGKVQRFRDRLDNIRQQMNSLTGTEEDIAKEASLLKAQRETEDAMQEAFAEAKSKGVDLETLKAADANFKQSQALYDLDTAVNRATSGKPAGVGTKGLSENVDPKKLAPRVTALWKSGRLQQAVGEENATDLMNYVGDAAKHQQTAIAIKNILKIAGVPTLGLLGLGEAHHLATLAH